MHKRGELRLQFPENTPVIAWFSPRHAQRIQDNRSGNDRATEVNGNNAAGTSCAQDHFLRPCAQATNKAMSILAVLIALLVSYRYVAFIRRSCLHRIQELMIVIRNLSFLVVSLPIFQVDILFLGIERCTAPGTHLHRGIILLAAFRTCNSCGIHGVILSRQIAGPKCR